jgi:nucleoside-diphosphate-sugar epimerase
MQSLPEKINTTEELDELMSRPSGALIDYVKTLNGDIMVLGAGGKIGPYLTLMAKRAIDRAGVEKNLIAVTRTDTPRFNAANIKTITCDLLDHDAVRKLPKVENIVFMAGRKFGTSGSEWLTWAHNCIIPYNVASTFMDARMVAFSTGGVYPIVKVETGGSRETDPPDPIGEYSMSCLGRERIFDYFSSEKGEKVIHIRLNYALDLRYGVLVDIATKVFNGEAIDITQGYFNGIWQGDVCDWVLRCFQYVSSPSAILNITGHEILSIRAVAETFGKLFGKKPVITGKENGLAYLSNASKAMEFFGRATVPTEKLIQWTAHWVKIGGENLRKPTHFETQNGKY